MNSERQIIKKINKMGVGKTKTFTLSKETLEFLKTVTKVKITEVKNHKIHVEKTWDNF